MEPEPDLSLCLVHRASNSEALPGFLESLLQHAGSLDFELIVVSDQPEHPVLAAMERDLPELVIFEAPGTDRPARAWNHAFRLATGRYISFWSEYVRFRPEGLVRLVDFLDETPEAGLVAPQVIDGAGTVLASVRSAPSLRTILFGHTPLGRLVPTAPLVMKRHCLVEQNHQRPFEADWLLADAGLLVRREVAEEIGLFDEGFLRHYADADYCLRAAQAGWHLQYLAEAKLLHARPDILARIDDRVEPKQGLAGDCTRLLLKKWLRPALL